MPSTPSVLQSLLRLASVFSWTTLFFESTSNLSYASQEIPPPADTSTLGFCSLSALAPPMEPPGSTRDLTMGVISDSEKSASPATPQTPYEQFIRFPTALGALVLSFLTREEIIVLANDPDFKLFVPEALVTTSLDTVDTAKFSENSLEKYFAIGFNRYFNGLHLHSHTLSPGDMETLKEHSFRMLSLKLTRCTFDPALLSQMALPKLRALTLKRCSLPLHGVLPLKTASFASTVHTLCLQESRMDTEGYLSILGSFTGLHTLSLEDNRLTNAALPLLRSVLPSTLTSLTLAWNDFTNDGCADLGKMPCASSLTHLNLTGQSLYEFGLMDLARSFPNLLSLSLSNNSFGGLPIGFCPPFFPKLKKLDLSRNLYGTFFRKRSITPFQYHLAGLTHLNLFANDLKDEDMESFVEAPFRSSLKVLDLRRNKISIDGVLNVLENFPALEELYIHQCAIEQSISLKFQLERTYPHVSIFLWIPPN